MTLFCLAVEVAKGSQSSDVIKDMPGPGSREICLMAHMTIEILLRKNECNKYRRKGTAQKIVRLSSNQPLVIAELTTSRPPASEVLHNDL